MSEFKYYTPEQEAKIEALRAKNVSEMQKNKALVNKLKDVEKHKPLGVKDRVFVVIDSSTIVGYITEKTGDTFTVSTPYGVMKNVELKYLSRRYYEDLSHVVIPDELKSISTNTLLSELRFRRSYSYSYNDYHCGTFISKFDDEQIKAELRLRPHVNKGGKNKKLVDKFSK